MFPFESKVVLTFDTFNLGDQDKQELINCFIRQLDEVEQKSAGISFRNFKAFYRRHKWLNSGQISFDFRDKQVDVYLQLNFYYVPVLFGFISFAFIVIHWKRLYLVGLLATILWLLYGLMYIWTSSMFKAAIRNTIKRYLSADSRSS